MSSAEAGGGRAAGVMINVLDPEFYVDPWQAYRWLRDEARIRITFTPTMEVRDA